jgi:hypothetical protein
MADPEIEQWNRRGSISLWHYDGFPKSYCGYHLSADQAGCAFLSGLIARFRNAQYPARKKIALDRPTPEVLSVPNCPKQCLPAEHVELCFRSDWDDGHWSVGERDGEVVIEMGARGLNDIDRGAADMARAAGDWSTGSGTQSLWFWWHPNTRPIQA